MIGQFQRALQLYRLAQEASASYESSSQRIRLTRCQHSEYTWQLDERHQEAKQPAGWFSFWTRSFFFFKSRAAEIGLIRTYEFWNSRLTTSACLCTFLWRSGVCASRPCSSHGIMRTNSWGHNATRSGSMGRLHGKETRHNRRVFEVTCSSCAAPGGDNVRLAVARQVL